MRIGCTGHRPNRLVTPRSEIVRRLTDALAIIIDVFHAAAPNEPVVAISALAEGADRLFADTAARLGLDLHALQPYSSADYVQTFASAKDTRDYHALLGRAVCVESLPGSLSDTSSAYAELGRAMVECSDVLIAIWDGLPAAGRGGTTEVIEYAITQGGCVVWVHAASNCSTVLLDRVVPTPQRRPLSGEALRYSIHAS